MVRIAAFTSPLLLPRIQPAPPRLAAKAGTETRGPTVAIRDEAARFLGERPSRPGAVPEDSVLLEGLRATLKEHTEKMAQASRAGRDPGKRLGEIQERLKALLQRILRAALMGDKRAAAALAKEASGLATDLAAAVKDASVEARTPGAEGSSTGTPPASAGSGYLPIGIEATLPQSAQTSEDRGLLLETGKAMLLLRGIFALAKSTLGRRGRSAQPEPLEPYSGDDFPRVMAAAELELEAAAASIQKTLGAAV